MMFSEARLRMSPAACPPAPTEAHTSSERPSRTDSQARSARLRAHYDHSPRRHTRRRSNSTAHSQGATAEEAPQRRWRRRPTSSREENRETKTGWVGGWVDEGGKEGRTEIFETFETFETFRFDSSRLRIRPRNWKRSVTTTFLPLPLPGTYTRDLVVQMSSRRSAGPSLVVQGWISTKRKASAELAQDTKTNLALTYVQQSASSIQIQ